MHCVKYSHIVLEMYYTFTTSSKNEMLLFLSVFLSSFGFSKTNRCSCIVRRKSEPAYFPRLRSLSQFHSLLIMSSLRTNPCFRNSNIILVDTGTKWPRLCVSPMRMAQNPSGLRTLIISDTPLENSLKKIS